MKDNSNNETHSHTYLKIISVSVLSNFFLVSMLRYLIETLFSMNPIASPEKKQPIVIFVLGGPGAGKGTQCANLVKDFGFLHLSAGDLLRAEQAREGSDFGELIATHIKEGKIVPMEVTLKLLEKAMAEGSHSLVLIDGFPRQMDQALEFEKLITPCRAVLYFQCSEEAMLQRLLIRGETSGRADDNQASIIKRFRTFHETSMPVIEYFQSKGKVITIDTLDSVDNVYQNTKREIEKLLV